MGHPLFSLTAIPPIADRDGHAGANAKFLMPFHGYWSASGQQYEFPSGTIKQDQSMRMGGIGMPSDTFQKDCCSCAAGGQNLLIDYTPT